MTVGIIFWLFPSIPMHTSDGSSTSEYETEVTIFMCVCVRMRVYVCALFKFSSEPLPSHLQQAGSARIIRSVLDMYTETMNISYLYYSLMHVRMFAYSTVVEDDPVIADKLVEVRICVWWANVVT